jgi:dolichyl-phosphate-mannose-protein mannosyltransferase
MSGSVRARRPASPPPGLPHAAPTQRFPHPRQDHLDADARRVAASKGFLHSRNSYPPGGLRLTSGEWKLIVVIVIIAAGIRFFRLSRPDSVVQVLYTQ